MSSVEVRIEPLGAGFSIQDEVTQQAEAMVDQMNLELLEADPRARIYSGSFTYGYTHSGSVGMNTMYGSRITGELESTLKDFLDRRIDVKRYKVVTQSLVLASCPTGNLVKAVPADDFEIDDFILKKLSEPDRYYHYAKETITCVFDTKTNAFIYPKHHNPFSYVVLNASAYVVELPKRCAVFGMRKVLDQIILPALRGDKICVLDASNVERTSNYFVRKLAKKLFSEEGELAHSSIRLRGFSGKHVRIIEKRMRSEQHSKLYW